MYLIKDMTFEEFQDAVKCSCGCNTFNLATSIDLYESFMKVLTPDLRFCVEYGNICTKHYEFLRCRDLELCNKGKGILGYFETKANELWLQMPLSEQYKLIGDYLNVEYFDDWNPPCIMLTI